MTRISILIAALGLITATPGVAAANVTGLWINPRGSVEVRTGPCDGKLCGWVVWASKEALADARDSGVAALIGTELLQDYQAGRGSTIWSGTVYVPDLGGHFSSTITPLANGTLRIKGCLFAGLICKSQLWQHAAGIPHD